MKRNRRNNARKERIIMIASSVFVLSALTMTGIYMKSNNVQEQDDGYTIDFTEMEDNAVDKAREIALNNQAEKSAAAGENGFQNNMPVEQENLEDDLDYLPMEAGSGLVKIPGLTDGIVDDTARAGEQLPGAEEMAGKEDLPATQEMPDAEELPAVEDTPAVEEAPAAESEASGEETESDAEEPARQEASAESGVVAETLHFSEDQGLLRPVGGEVLIPFSMDGSVYFSTLDQFKYNPAMMIAAAEGSAVTACAEGKVIDIFEDEEIGHAVTMELGDGYQITYGQLYDINVTLDSHVQEGDTIASVAAPTKYFSVEGSNLYLKLTANGTPVNPEILFR